MTLIFALIAMQVGAIITGLVGVFLCLWALDELLR